MKRFLLSLTAVLYAGLAYAQSLTVAPFNGQLSTPYTASQCYGPVYFCTYGTLNNVANAGAYYDTVVLSGAASAINYNSFTSYVTTNGLNAGSGFGGFYSIPAIGGGSAATLWGFYGQPANTGGALAALYGDWETPTISGGTTTKVYAFDAQLQMFGGAATTYCAYCDEPDADLSATTEWGWWQTATNHLNGLASDLVSLGPHINITGSCAVSGQTGGIEAGQFVASGACVAGTYVLGFPDAAPIGYVCAPIQDMTTTTDSFHETAYTTTSATFTGSAANNDHLVFGPCRGF